MTTRWFVEVSRADADTQKERYCVEALQWQQALQQARKLRGDRGALSRFAIELLESGYRATDPGARLRYTISKAPHDAPLSGGSSPTNGASKSAASLAAAPPAPPASAPKAAVSEAPRSLPLPKVQGSARAGSLPPRASSAPSSRGRPSGTPALEVPRRNSGSIQTSPAVPKPQKSVRPPKVTVKKADSAASVAEATVPADAPSATPPPSAEPPLVTPTTELTELDPMTAPPPDTAPVVPGLEIVAMRKEEPTDAVPITYREYSFAAAAGAEPEELERLARAAFEQVRAAIAPRASQKFVQIALFDHRFEGRPERPPVAVLAWKDWRGEPAFQFRGARLPAPSSLPPTSLPAPAVAAQALASEAPAIAPTAPTVIEAAPTAPAVVQTAPAVAHAAPAIPSFPAPHSLPLPPGVQVAPQADAASMQPVASAAPVAEAPAVVAASVEAPARAQAPSSPDATRGKLPSRPGSSPHAAGRRRGAGEDLIIELFEQMHELNFAPDIVTGSDYVLGVMLGVMPSEGILIHVFDINTRQFVVVRAAGPNARSVLLHRTPDTFKLFRELFRRASARAFTDAGNDPNFQGGRWERLGVTVKNALCGGVKHGGRYLGVIELVNPAGGTPFQQSEVNALDYICAQFADFVASRPLVIDEDAVLPRT
jgi:hypothetical protein